MSFKGKRILVTGGKGFVGKYLVKALTQRGAEIINFDVVDGLDVTNWEHVKKVGDIHIAYHLAAIMYVPFAWENPRIVYNVNVGGTLNILELCRIRDIERLIFASSYLYGHPKYLPIDEKHPINPTNPYARSKIVGEELCQAYHEDYGIRCVILRPFNIYGKGQNERFLIPSIIKQIESGSVRLDDPEPKRDFVYIDDAINAYTKAGRYDSTDFEIFNIGSGVSYSVDEIVRKLIDISGLEVIVNYRNKRRKNEIMNVIVDIKKAKKKLNWEPMVNINNGMKMMIIHEKQKTNYPHQDQSRK